MRANQPIVTMLMTSVLLAACAEQKPANKPVEPAGSSITPPIPGSKPDQQSVSKPEVPAVKPGQVTSIDMGRLFTLGQMGKVFVMDTRPPLFYRLGHINGATSFPLIKYDKALRQHRPALNAAQQSGKIIVTYCQNSNCPDAHKLARKLASLGYNVSVYSGGWEEWKHSGLE